MLLKKEMYHSLFKLLLFHKIMKKTLYGIITCCRLLGAIIIVVGFYSVLWGKAEESKIDKNDDVTSLESSVNQEPLLRNSIEEHRSSVQ